MSDHGVYNLIGPARPGRSAFDRSHLKLFDCSIGQLIPVLVEDVQPGDIVEIANANVIRAQPLVVPIYHRLEVFSHTFFVPYRLLMQDWERFITGGSSGDLTTRLPTVIEGYQWSGNVVISRYTLWDYFGFPIADVENGDTLPSNSMGWTSAPDVLDLPWRAYWAIWRDYYRDSNHQLNFPNPKSPYAGDVNPSNIPCGDDFTEQLSSLDAYCSQGVSQDGFWVSNQVAYRCWAKDYFTSALPWQQRGTSPAIPISGTTSAQWLANQFHSSTSMPPINTKAPVWTNLNPPEDDVFMWGDTATGTGPADGLYSKNLRKFFNSNTVDFATTGVDISDLRYAVQVQRWMERNARGGYRYNEFIQAHFGVSPRDERLQRPEYIGGSRQPVIISEVLQNSATVEDSPQGNFAGHGMSVAQSFNGKYRVQEHGIIMTIMSIMPEAVYQQGIPRQWRRKTRFDFYSPEFAHLSEQEILKSEICWLKDPIDNTRFGFQGAFDEYRTAQSVVCGKMATDLNMWTLSRLFDGVPSLNEAFLTTEQMSKNRREAWAVPGVVHDLEGQFFVQWRNIVKMLRPMPYLPEPGLMDHF